jgi:hypothetical protein
MSNVIKMYQFNTYILIKSTMRNLHVLSMTRLVYTSGSVLIKLVYTAIVVMSIHHSWIK